MEVDTRDNASKGKAGRHIVFVGNLPYTATDKTIYQHFAHLKPSSVRCLTKDRVENTCRGFAFVEFSNSTHMRTCLDKMHHTLFDDGLSPARKINVQLTLVKDALEVPLRERRALEVLVRPDLLSTHQGLVVGDRLHALLAQRLEGAGILPKIELSADEDNGNVCLHVVE
ncbi:hypothetical protein BN1708_013707, partial [Verticillium longisporum]